MTMINEKQTANLKATTRLRIKKKKTRQRKQVTIFHNDYVVRPVRMEQILRL